MSKCGRTIFSGVYANTVKCIQVFLAVGPYEAFILTQLSHIYTLTNWNMWLIVFGGILVFLTYMALTCFLSHDADDAINVTTAFVMLK